LSMVYGRLPVGGVTTAQDYTRFWWGMIICTESIATVVKYNQSMVTQAAVLLGDEKCAQTSAIFTSMHPTLVGNVGCP
jgi:hypothetical protein